MAQKEEGMELFFKRLVYQWNQMMEERRWKRILKNVVIVPDTSTLLDPEAFKGLKRFKRVIIPEAVFEHLQVVKRYGVGDKKYTKIRKGLAVEAFKVIKKRIAKETKEYKWDIDGSHGTGLVSKFGEIKLKELSKETIKEIQMRKGKNMNPASINLRDPNVLGSHHARKLRVLATAKFLQGRKGVSGFWNTLRGRKVILATQDIILLAIAEEEVIGLVAVAKLTKVYLLDKF